MTNTTTKIIGTAFVTHVDQTATPTIENPTAFLKKAYTPYYLNNQELINYGVYKLMGYKYNFKSYLKSYLYKQYSEWHEAFAPNKTCLRQIVYGKIDKIIQI